MDENFSRDEVRDAAADRLATASMVLGIISLFSTLCCCPFIFSALGIILALLSKGAEKCLRPRAQKGLIFSVIGFVVSIVLTVFTIALPIFLFKTNPAYKEFFIESYEEALEENEDLLRQLYGDDMYNQIHDQIEDFK